jgi:lipopolysaccharide transport system ATP-binding protein
VLGLTHEEIDERFDSIVSFADIGQFIDQPVKTYSSGMSVRLAFAVQAQVDPNILIVDEALSVGDIRFQNKCFRRFDELRKNGCSILFVTHSLSQVDAYCESAIWLEAGCIKAQGKPASLTRAYTNLMVHGLSTASDITQQDKCAEKKETQSQDEKPNDLNKNWLALINCKNITNPGMVKVNRFRIGFNEEFGLTEIESQPIIIIVEFEAEFGEFVSSPLLALGILNNLNEPVIHFNSFATWCSLDKIAPGEVVRFKYQFTMPPLRPGEYLITIGIDNGVPNASTVLCHIYDLFPFRVRAQDSLHIQSGYIAVTDATIEMRTDRKI